MADSKPPTGSHLPQRPATQQTPTGATQKLTGQVPHATTSVPRPQTTSVPRPATSSTQKVQTGSTQKVQTGATQKMQTGSTQKAPTQAVPKAQTSSVPRPTTSRAAAPGTSRNRALTARTTKRTQQFVAAARRPKKNPLVVGGVVIGVVVVGFVVILMIPNAEDRRTELKAKITALEEQAVKLRNENKIDAAIAKYREIQQVAEGDSGLKSRYRTLEGVIKDLEAEKKLAGAAEAEWTALRSEWEKPPAERMPKKDILLKAIGMVRRYQEAGVPWFAELKALHDKVQKEVEEEVAAGQRRQFSVFRQELVTKFGLGSSDARIGPAIVELKKWYPTVEVEEKTKGEQFQRELEGQAREAYKRVEKIFEIKLSEGKDSARKYLGEAKARLAGSSVDDDLKNLEKRLD